MILGRITLTGLLAIAGASSFAIAAEPETDMECFDTVVFATIGRQIPSELPKAEPDTIIMSWPWFLDLNVQEVLRGQAPMGRLTVLSVQHTYIRENLGPQRWWLRRNSLGAFNALTFGDGGKDLARCKAGTSPAEPYIEPPEGKSLADFIRETERANRK